MKPTVRGAGAVVGGIALLVVGFTFDYPELAVLGAAALIAVAYALAYAAFRPTLTVRRTVEPDRVTRGEASTQIVTVRNSSRLITATLVAQDRCGGRRVPVPLLRLRRGQDTSVTYPVPTHRRGVVHVGPLTVTRRDPLGLVSLERTHGGTATVWVYPRAHPMSAVPAGIARSLDGRIDRVPHGSITFDTLREYVIGDELRHVHWRTTARVGELMVREHLDTSLPRIVVLLDDRSGSYPEVEHDGSYPEVEHDGSADEGERDDEPAAAPDGFEHACEAAASVLMAAVREELPVDLFTVTGQEAPSNRPGTRRVDARPLLDRLAEAELIRDRRGRALGAALDRLRQYRLGDTLVYLSGTGNAQDLASLGALRSRYPTVVAGVFGGPDDVPPGVEGIHVLAVPDAPAFALAWDGIGQW